VIVNDSFNNNNFTTINDNDFTNNGVIIDGNGNRVTNTVSDDDTTVTNVNSNNTTVAGDQIEFEENGNGDQIIAGDDAVGRGAANNESNVEINDDGTGGGLLLDDVNVVAPVQVAAPILSGNETEDNALQLVPIASPIDQSEEAAEAPAE